MISNPKCEKNRTSLSSCEQIRPMVELSGYHLIFDLYGFFMVTNEDQTKFSRLF
jgi:hypothetical protein